LIVDDCRAAVVAVAREAIAACHGEALTREAVRRLGIEGPVWLVGAGKAAGQMARGVAAAVPVRGGVVVTKEGSFDGFAPSGTTVRFAGHPEPDARSVAAADAVLAFLRRRTADDHVVAVISGGTSALLGAPIDGVTLEELAATTRSMLAAGEPVAKINEARGRLGRAAGGKLAAACEARIDVLLASDVLGDDPAVIGSGPFVADGRSVRHHLVATPATLLQAAARAARGRFGVVHTLEPLAGDVGEVAERLCQEAGELEPGEALVAVGEPTVRLPEDAGRGGRCQELALEMAGAIEDRPIAFCALASDGNDGPTDAAGAAVDGASWAALVAVGDPEAALARCDAYPLLDAAGLLERLGPTGTNLLDVYVLAAE
jgi:glycerate 2-kinase